MARKTASPARLTTRELIEGFADDDLGSFYLGVRDGAPFDAWTLFATSFERRRGIYDAETRSWTVEPGRVVELSKKLAEKIRERAKRIFLNCEVRPAPEPMNPGRVKMGKIREPRRRNVVDLEKNPKAEKLITRYPSRMNADGTKTEWRCLADFLILEERAAGSLTRFDHLSAENNALEEANRRLREQLAAATQE